MSATAVLLTAHGTVERFEDLPTFLAKIRRGRPAPRELVEEVERRYRLIGGSPLLRITREQAAKLERRLDVPVLVGMRLSSPWIADVMRDATKNGIRRFVSLPLAPQSVHVYHAAVREAAAELAKEGTAVDVVEAPPWGEEPRFLDALSGTIDDALAKLDDRARAPVILTAHSLPLRILAAGDPYERDVRAMASALVARRAETSRTFVVAFQSQGMDGGEWLGPELSGEIRRLANEGAKEIVVAPIGFVAEHVETLYDLDVDAKALGKSLGIRLSRAPTVNAREEMIDALAAVAKRLV